MNSVQVIDFKNAEAILYSYYKNEAQGLKGNAKQIKRANASLFDKEGKARWASVHARAKQDTERAGA